MEIEITKTEMLSYGWFVEELPYENFFLNVGKKKIWLSVNTEKEQGLINFNSDGYVFDFDNTIRKMVAERVRNLYRQNHEGMFLFLAKFGTSRFSIQSQETLINMYQFLTRQ